MLTALILSVAVEARTRRSTTAHTALRIVLVAAIVLRQVVLDIVARVRGDLRRIPPDSRPRSACSGHRRRSWTLGSARGRSPPAL